MAINSKHWAKEAEKLDRKADKGKKLYDFSGTSDHFRKLLPFT